MNPDSDRRLHTRNNKNLKLCFSLNTMGRKETQRRKKKMEAPSIARTRKYQKTLWNVNRLRDSLKECG